MNIQPQNVKKFYFLEYYYILLESINTYSNLQDVFNSFKELKNKYQLGESRYKKLTIDTEDLTKRQIDKYKYTFKQVLLEAEMCKLITFFFRDTKTRISTTKGKISDFSGTDVSLTEIGKNALKKFKKNKFEFNLTILQLNEVKYNAFYHLVRLCYSDSKLKNGLMVFPIYSPLKLGFEKARFILNKHVFEYSKKLREKLEQDIRTYTNKIISLSESEKDLISKLVSDGLISFDLDEAYNPQKYNAIINRFRKYWLNFFLKNVYKYEYSYSTFSLWIERGRQIGITNTTEFFPDFNGRIVYPTSIITEKITNEDFFKVFSYEKENMYIHKPKWEAEKNQQEFVKSLSTTYFEFKKTRKTHFINLLDIKEKVCFKLRIPGFIFDDFLEKTYILNLKEELPVQISLEADKLPHETNAMYLKREPILVNGIMKNIIAINYRRSN